MRSHLTGQPSCPSDLTTPTTMESSMTMSSPPTPGTATSLSTMYSVGSRTKRLGRKLSFWRKRETSAADVRGLLHALQKSHRKHVAATQYAINTLHDWASQLEAPPKFPKEWQARMASPDLRALLLGVCEALYPVCATEAMLTQILADFTGGFQSISYYEENCKNVADELATAERRFYRERSRCAQQIQAKIASSGDSDAETVAAGKLAAYENACLGLRSQMVDAGNQYRRQCFTELPRQFEPVQSFMREVENTVRQATIAIQNARMGELEADYRYPRGTTTPGYAALYTPSTLPPRGTPSRVPPTSSSERHTFGAGLVTGGTTPCRTMPRSVNPASTPSGQQTTFLPSYLGHDWSPL